jgi:FHS family L-fucose permease-like MFS transporter
MSNEDMMVQAVAPPTDGVVEISQPGGAPASGNAGRIVPFVVVLFFAWGFATVLNDTLIPKLKGLFSLTYAEVMLTNSAFFVAYFVVSVPAAILLSKIGYLRGVVAGLLLMAVGCLLFTPAAKAGVYPGFLLALFVLAAGITMLQVAANPLIAILGSPEKSHFRLNLAQTMNSLGTFIGPFVGAALILKNGITPPDPASTSPAVLAAYKQTEINLVQGPFMVFAIALAAFAVLFWLLRNTKGVPSASHEGAAAFSLSILKKYPRLTMGAVSIFVYVGAEVSIGSLMVNYLMQARVLHIAAADAGKLVAFYWGAAMVGRIIGSALMYFRVPAARLLMLFPLGAIVLIAVSVTGGGWIAGGALIAVGLFNSIQFPTIFSLAIEGMGDETPQGSAVLCMAIVGGAIIPPLMGYAADHLGLGLSMIVPALCYLWIGYYGWQMRKGGLNGKAAA